MCFDVQKEDELFHGWNDESVMPSREILPNGKESRYKTGPYGKGKGLDYFVNNAGGIDIIIGGPPCQAYSVAGRVRDENGMKDDYKEKGIRISQYDDKTAVLREKNKNYANYIGGNIKPDIIIYDPETGNYVVFDVKYKDSLNSRYARPDRMQILAYGLMMGCSNVGNIFPTQDGTNNVYYKRNQINSNEARTRYYNQLEVAIDPHWGFEVRRKDDEMKIRIMKYLKRLLTM